MASKRFRPEQIISKLREAEVLLAQGEKMRVVCKRIAVTEQTYYRWRKEYGGLRLDQAKRLKELVADLSLDNQILKAGHLPLFPWVVGFPVLHNMSVSNPFHLDG